MRLKSTWHCENLQTTSSTLPRIRALDPDFWQLIIVLILHFIEVQVRTWLMANHWDECDCFRDKELVESQDESHRSIKIGDYRTYYLCYTSSCYEVFLSELVRVRQNGLEGKRSHKYVNWYNHTPITSFLSTPKFVYDPIGVHVDPFIGILQSLIICSVAMSKKAWISLPSKSSKPRKYSCNV